MAGKSTSINRPAYLTKPPRRLNSVYQDLTMPNKTISEKLVPIKHDTDIIVACQKGRTLAENLGFSSDHQTVIVIAISELARNIVKYAKQGKIILRRIQQDNKHGLVIIAQDEGPGISNIELALQDGYSTGGGLGLGLPGVKRLMDEFEIVSQVNQGTTITIRKWL